MNFSDYLKEEVDHSTDQAVDNVVIATVKDRSLEDVVKTSSPQTWTAKIINGTKYLIYNKKYLNVTRLREELGKLYTEKGYNGYGFSKLTESEIVRYKTVKNIIMPSFYDDFTDEVNPIELAKVIFNNELTDLSWTPEEVTR